MSFTTVAVCSVGVVANPDETVSAVSGVNEAIGTGPKDGLVVVAPVQLVKVVAVLFMGQGPLFGLAVGLIESVKRRLLWGSRLRTPIAAGVAAGITSFLNDLAIIVVIVVSFLVRPFLCRQVGLVLLRPIVVTLSKDSYRRGGQRNGGQRGRVRPNV